jgi:hypothetical protein
MSRRGKIIILLYLSSKLHMPHQLRIHPYVPIRHLIADGTLTYSQMTERSQTSDHSSRQPQAPYTPSPNRYEDRLATSTNASSHSHTRPTGFEPSGVIAAADLVKELAVVRHALGERDKEILELREVSSIVQHDAQQAHAASQAEAQKRHELELMLENVIHERNTAAAQQLTVDTFDSSLDRVSEGQLVSEVEALNNSISELVMNILDQATTGPPEQPTPQSLDFVLKEPLLTFETPDKMSKEGRELLVDAAMHRLIIRRLNPTVFTPFVAPDIPEAKYFEELYVQVIFCKGE